MNPCATRSRYIANRAASEMESIPFNVARRRPSRISGGIATHSKSGKRLSFATRRAFCKLRYAIR
jgi:hypothetical protein